MNKSDLVDAVASSADLTKASAARAVDATLDAIGVALGNGDSVSLVGFGTFSVRHRAARDGRNPQTGAPMHIPASKVPGFKAGKGLKDKVKGIRIFDYALSPEDIANIHDEERKKLKMLTTTTDNILIESTIY